MSRNGGFGRGPGNHGGGVVEKPKNFKGTIKKLISYLKPFIPSFIIAIFFALLSTAFTIVGPKILGLATSKIFEGVIEMAKGTATTLDFSYIGRVILFALFLYLASSLFSYIQGYLMTGISMKVTYNLRKEISVKINNLPLSYFDKVSHGEVLSRVTNDVDTISQSLNQSISQLVTSVTTLVGVLIMMLTISPLMTLVALISIPVSLIFVSFVVKRSQKYFKRQQDYLGNLNGHIEEMYSGHIVVKAFNKEKDSINEFNSLNERLCNTAWKAQFFSGLMMPIMQFIGNLSYVVVCIVGAFLANKGTILVGDIQAFIQYVRNFNQPINQLANISNVLQQTAAASERVFEFLETKEEEKVRDNAISFANEGDNLKDNQLYLKDIKGDVAFKDISFGYKADEPIIKNFSVNIKSGQMVAIVGPTGAGKTTIVKLLMRFYELNKGDITIDGINIKDFHRRELRKMIGMVLQDTWLYNASVMDNIRYGNLTATDDEVVKAAKAAHVDHFILTQPEGYGMIINEESSNISQGQKQLLTIARALLADPKILILDEATSSVDTRTEVTIQNAMKKLMKGRTSFVIAHRLSTIKNADLILVMNEGNVIEQGTHEELLNNKGFYYNFYNSQFN